jgi:hypothetical protein
VAVAKKHAEHVDAGTVQPQKRPPLKARPAHTEETVVETHLRVMKQIAVTRDILAK